MRTVWNALRVHAGEVTLVVLNGLLLTVLGVVIMRGTQTDALLSIQGRSTSEVEAFDFDVPHSVTDFDVIQAQPLFHASRIYISPPDPVVQAAVVAPPDYRFAGAMSTPGGSLRAILVHTQSGAQVRIQKGESLDGWTVEDVFNQRVVLAQDGRLAEIGNQKPSDATGRGLTVATASMTAAPPSSHSGGIRVLSGGSSIGGAGIAAQGAPKPPPGGVGARLYRPPPTQ